LQPIVKEADPSIWQDFIRTHWLVFLDGASGSGKSTFKNMLLQDADFGFTYAKRYTTRAPRIDDAQNDDYIFISMEEFKARESSHDLIEFRHFLFGMSYGIGRTVLVEAGQRSRATLSVMNLGSVSLIKQSIPNALCILIDAKVEAIEHRLRDRGLNTEEQIQERLANARDVKRIAKDYDFVFDNEQGDIERAYRRLKAFLMTKRPW
jgi:guanylate kinase